MPASTSTDRSQYPAAGVWELDPAHTSVEFVARHMMVTKVRGRFADLSGKFEIGDEITESVIDVDIDVASLSTGSADRDGHLISADFFDVDQHPTIHFTSTFITPAGDRWKAAGDLTIRGVTKPVTLYLEYLGQVQDPWGNTKAQFSMSTEVEREDWGLTWNVPLEGVASWCRRRSGSRSRPSSGRFEPPGRRSSPQPAPRRFPSGGVSRVMGRPVFRGWTRPGR